MWQFYCSDNDVLMLSLWISTHACTASSLGFITCLRICDVASLLLFTDFDIRFCCYNMAEKITAATRIPLRKRDLVVGKLF